MTGLQDESGSVHSSGRILEDISIADFIPHYPTELPKRFQPTPSGDVIIQFTILSSKTRRRLLLQMSAQLIGETQDQSHPTFKTMVLEQSA
jgi:hypothetical protein